MRVHADRVPASHALLEAGGETSAILLAAMARRLDAMAGGDILEVHSRSPSARFDAVAWCHVTGHELVALMTSGELTHFWIRKREE